LIQKAAFSFCNPFYPNPFVIVEILRLFQGEIVTRLQALTRPMLQSPGAIKQITAREGGDGVAVGPDFGKGRHTEGDQKNDGE
jgi:hypothetical protein